MLIGLLGGECTGKTALAQALAVDLGAVVTPEALRDFVAEHGRTPGRGEQAEIMARQEALTRQATLAAGPIGTVVADPSAAMTAVYSAVYFDDHALDERAAASLQRCEVVAWCQPDIPWEPDGLMRDGEPMRAAAHAAIDALLLAFDIPFVRVAGPLQQRVDSIRAAVARIGS